MRSVPASVLLALGSNLGDRVHFLRQAIDRLSRVLTLARVSSVYRTEPFDCEPGAGEFLNLVVLGATRLSAWQVLRQSIDIERRLGRAAQIHRRIHESRRIDIDLIFYSAHLIRRRFLQVPHPRFRMREFVMAPIRELQLPWFDPSSMLELRGIQGEGRVERVGAIY